MLDNRLLLRVLTKLMLLTGVLFLAYAFVAGLMEPEAPTVAALDVDVSAIAPGDAAYFSLGQRRLIVINRSSGPGPNAGKGYGVFYGRDRVYGCELRLEGSRLRSRCADVEYGLDGRLIRGTPYHEDLQSPDYQLLDRQRLRIRLR